MYTKYIQNYFNALRNNSLNLAASKMSQAISSSSRNFLSKQFTHTHSRNETCLFTVLTRATQQHSFLSCSYFFSKWVFSTFCKWEWKKSFLECVDERDNANFVKVVCNSWKLEFAFRWILIISFPSQFLWSGGIFFFCRHHHRQRPISIKWLMLLLWQAIKWRQLDCFG